MTPILPSLALADAPVVDAHMHPWRTADLVAREADAFLDRTTMLGMCLISSGAARAEDGAFVRSLTATTPLAHTLTRRLAALLDVDDDPTTIGTARRQALLDDADGYYRRLWHDAGLVAVLCDDGFPQPQIPAAELATTSGLDVHRVARIEPLIAELRESAESYDALEDALEDALRTAADAGAVGFKSIIAYRTGLDVERHGRDHVRAAYRRWRDGGWSEDRLDAKPVRDALLHRTAEVAHELDRVLHVHCGGGDAETLLPHARPQDFQPFLVEHAAVPTVLVHGGQPWLDIGAHLAATLPHVYLDLSITVPWASLAIDAKLEAVLGQAPPAKVLHGTDTSGEPEVLWLGAQLSREALGRTLTRAVERDWTTPADAARIARGVLADNTLRLHGIS